VHGTLRDSPLTWSLEVKSTQLDRVVSIWQQFSWRQ